MRNDLMVFESAGSVDFIVFDLSLFIVIDLSLRLYGGSVQSCRRQ